MMFKYLKQFSKDFTRIANSLEIIATGKLESNRIEESRSETKIESTSLEDIYNEEQGNLERDIASRIETEFAQREDEEDISYQNRVKSIMIEDLMSENEVEKLF